MTKQWGIPQQNLSQFKKSFVSQVFQQNSEVIEQKLKALPRGVILGNETYLGSRGNSDVEIVNSIHFFYFFHISIIKVKISMKHYMVY